MPGSAAGRREVGEVARALPVRDPRHEHLVEVAEHGRERLRRARAATAGSAARISPGSTRASTGCSRTLSR